MELIRQPNGWTCGAACACMVTHTSLAEFYKFCGHDGSEKVKVTPVHWQGVRCFDMKEIIRYLLEFDLFLGCGAAGGIERDFNPVTQALTISVDWEECDIFIDVSSGPGGKGVHQVLWSKLHGRIIDPINPHAMRKFGDYEIVGWWPVVRVNNG